MSSALTNSLMLLNEIREQLNASKIPAKKGASPLKTSAFDKSFPLSGKQQDLHDSYATGTSLATEEEPLRVELNRRAMQQFGNTPPVSQKIRIEETEEDSLLPEPNFAQNLQNTEVSPYKRKIVGKENFASTIAIEKITQRSQEMASNLKKLLNKEIETFAKECDSLKDKVQSILNSRGSRFSSDANFQLKSTRRNISPSNKENITDATLNQITRKIEKLAGEFDERKNRSLKNTSVLETLGGSGSKSRAKYEDFDTPSLSGTTAKILFE